MCLLIVPIRFFALPVVSSLNFDLTILFHAVLELHCSVFVVLRSSSNIILGQKT